MATKENIEEIYLPECMLKMENLNEIYPKDGWDKLKGFEHAFQTIIDKIESNRPLHPLEQVHPKLSQWAPLIEKKCFEKLSNIVEEERPNSTAAAVLALFEEKGFIKLDVSGDKMPLWK